MPLTLTLIRSAEGRHRLYTLSDGGGMVLQVTPKGSKRAGGSDIGIGDLPT